MKLLSWVQFLGMMLLPPLLAHTQQSDSLTVEDAIRQVISHHPLVQQASEAVEASRARVEMSRSGMYPTSNVNLGYVRLDPIAELAFPGLGDFKLFPENNYDEHIGVSQTVFDFGKTSASVDLAQQSVESMNDNVQLVKTNLAFQTIQAFYAILFLRQSLIVQDQQIDVLNQHLGIVQKKVEAGTSTDFDVLTTQVRIAAAQNKKFDIQNEIEQQEAVFRRLLGLPYSQKVKLRGEFNPIPVALNVDSLTAAAMSRRTELKLSHDGEKAAELQEHVADLRNMPALKANVAYGLKNGYIPDLDVLRGNWVFNVEANIPVFDGFHAQSERQEAKANHYGAIARSRETERMIVNEVQQAISNVRTNGEKIQTSTVQVRQAEQALQMATVRFESGVITNLDLLDAQTAVAQAKLSYLDALKQFVVSRYSLEKAVGGNLPGD